MRYLRESPLLYVLFTLMLLMLMRLWFLSQNPHFLHLTSSNSTDLAKALLFGLRLDLIIAFYLFLPVFIILSFIRIHWLRFAIALPICLMVIGVSAIDAAYFRYAKERLGFDFWNLIKGENNISLSTYFDGEIVGVIIILLSSILISYLLIKLIPTSRKSSQLLINLAFILFTFFIARGGMRSRPLRSADAASHVSTNFIPLSLNPLLLLYEAKTNPNTNAYLDQLTTLEVDSFQPQSGELTKYNFVVVILESFGKEYTGLNHNYALNYTPNLNRLMEQSVVCTDAYSNGLKSMDAVPALFSGIPRLTSNAFITSPNSLKKLPSVFNTLKTVGYHSSFFHGADNNTMGFRSFLMSQGLGAYFGLDEYPSKDEDFDGNWGIYDVPYLEYVANQLNDQEQPFCSGVFTLSSHHPYTVPSEYADSFPSGSLKIHKSIGYTDFALARFLEICSKMPWFDNTIFIITADHSSENSLHAYRTASGKYEVPLLLYAPSILKPSVISKTVSHCDVFPTILDLVNFGEPTSILGSSIFDTSNQSMVCHFDNGVNYITSNGWSLGVDLNSALSMYNLQKDPNCLDNVLEDFPNSANRLNHAMNTYYRKYLSLIE